MLFKPDYNNIVRAARNLRPDRIPLYEHLIADSIMEEALGTKFSHLYNKNSTKIDYLRNYVQFFYKMGYDTVSFERCIGDIMPGSGALGKHMPGIIKSRDDFEKYPWERVPQLYFDRYAMDFECLRSVMPEGMKAIGGVGNGLFECVQDIVGYTQLCYIAADDPELYGELFRKAGEVMYAIWKKFLSEFGDVYCVLRFGDDLGFKSSTLLKPADIVKHIIPVYKRIVSLVHSYDKPFLLHSCGKIFDIMDDLIKEGGIDAKHSNEDQIAPFIEWIEKYGDKIGLFGGIDTDNLCSKSNDQITAIAGRVYEYAQVKGGIAIGSGNSIPSYVPSQGYRTMIKCIRDMRGDR